MYNLQTNNNKYACNICICIIIFIQYKSKPMTISWPYILYSQSIYYIFVSRYLSTILVVLHAEACQLHSAYTLHRSLPFPNQNNVWNMRAMSLLFLITVWHYSCMAIQFWKLVFAGAFKDHPIFKNQLPKMLSQGVLLEITPRRKT